jgi:arylsulfatase A-like enzyme
MVREELTCYYAVISHLDRQIGRILAALDETEQARDTVVIFTSDHGLAIGSHGLRGKQNLYEHTINVPLVIRGPGIAPGERRTAQAYLRDLYPTVCELAGVAIPASVEGRSIVPVLADAGKSIHPYIFGYFRDSQRMIRGERWKLIEYPLISKTHLFDLENDPDELRDLSAEPRQRPVLDELRRRLKDWQRAANDPLAKS